VIIAAQSSTADLLGLPGMKSSIALLDAMDWQEGKER